MQVKHVKLLTVREVVKKLGISRTTLYRLRQQDDFPDCTLITGGEKGRIGFIESDVDEWILKKK